MSNPKNCLPNGWKSHYTALCEAVGGEGNLQQAKEKFGKLTIYTLNRFKTDPSTLSTIAKTCSETCVGCGTLDNVKFRTDGWHGPRCDTCEDAYQKNAWLD